MPDDDPATALQTLENALRLAVRAVLSEAWRDKLGHDDRLQARRIEEAKRRDGTVLSEDLLSFAEFYQLTSVIIKNWNDFQPVFQDKKRTEVWFAAAEDVRNAIAHSRQLLEFERRMIAGISGQVRNLVTIYRTEQAPASAHYAVIERAVDQYGIEGRSANSYDLASTPIRIEVGEVIEFDCVGRDARGREMDWFLFSRFTPLDFNLDEVCGDYQESQLIDKVMRPVERKRGDRVSLQWRPSERDVGEDCEVYVFLRVTGSNFNRFHSNMGIDTWSWGHMPCQDMATFTYAVNPPLD